MDDMIRQYLMKKMRGDDERDYSELMARDNDRLSQLNALQGIAKGAAQVGSIGGKIADTSALEDSLKGQMDATRQGTQDLLSQEKLAASRDDDRFDAASKLAQMDQADEESDPMSQKSQAARATLSSMMPSLSKQPWFEKTSAKSLRENNSLFSSMMAAQNRQKDTRDQSEGTFVNLGAGPDGRAQLYNNKTGETRNGPMLAPNPTALAKQEEQQNKVDESTYRYNALKNNAQKLKDIIQQTGTFELFGPDSAKMDSLIYQMAVDYAKLVDPDSVAREGEVAAAQKYMVPVRSMGGLGTKNSTASAIIDNYIADLDTRVESRNMAKKKNMPGGNNYMAQPQGDGATAVASPGMAPDRQKRLQELRDKYGSGK
jgi:hypothetical protein